MKAARRCFSSTLMVKTWIIWAIRHQFFSPNCPKSNQMWQLKWPGRTIKTSWQSQKSTPASQTMTNSSKKKSGPSRKYKLCLGFRRNKTRRKIKSKKQRRRDKMLQNRKKRKKKQSRSKSWKSRMRMRSKRMWSSWCSHQLNKSTRFQRRRRMLKRLREIKLEKSLVKMTATTLGTMISMNMPGTTNKTSGRKNMRLKRKLSQKLDAARASLEISMSKRRWICWKSQMI